MRPCLKYVTRRLLRLFSLSFCHDRGRRGLGRLCQGRVPSRTHWRLLLRRPLRRRQEARLGPFLDSMARKGYKVSAFHSPPSPLRFSLVIPRHHPRRPSRAQPTIALPPSRARHPIGSVSGLYGSLWAYPQRFAVSLSAAFPPGAIAPITLHPKIPLVVRTSVPHLPVLARRPWTPSHIAAARTAEHSRAEGFRAGGRGIRPSQPTRAALHSRSIPSRPSRDWSQVCDGLLPHMSSTRHRHKRPAAD